MTRMLLEWVFTSVFLILVVLALRAALGRRISARMRYALWAVVLLRLLVPVQLFESPIAGTWVLTEARTEWNAVAPPPAMTAPSLPEPPAAGITGLPVTDVKPGSVPTLPGSPAAPDAPEPPAAPDLSALAPWLGRAWLAGTGLAALVLLASNLRFYARLRKGRVPLEGADCPLAVYEAGGLPSPCLFGIVRPAVYVAPETAADPDMLRHVLAHEYTHFRQGDHIWSLLRCAALAVHWWNPLVWLGVGLSRRDGELACDEGALRRLGDGERAAYGNTLLALVTAKPGPGDLFRCATTMAGDKRSLKERITRIAQAPRRWLWAAVAVVLATALACACAFGQAEPEEEVDALLWPYGVSRMTYIRDAGGFGGDFAVTLNQDGTFSYYAGLLSSYIGMGTWTQEDGVVCLADEGLEGSAGIQRYYFTVEDGNLVFQAEKSAKFMYVDVKDGERFSRRTDDLRFSLDENDLVVIEGEVDGLTLREGTYWQPSGAPAKTLTMSYPFEGAPEGVIMEAYWADSGTVDLRTRVDAQFSGPPEIFWIFTVELYGIHGAQVTEMVPVEGMSSHASLDTPLQLYPETISDEEAIRAARIAARLLTAAEEWYNNHKTPVVEIAFQYTGNNPFSSFAVPADVLNAAKANVAAQFQADVPGGVLTSWGESYNDETGAWEPVLLAKAVPFDRVRIKNMEGPDLYTVQANGEDVVAELWKVAFEYHTTVPEFAQNLLAGGMTLDDEGWMNFTNGFNYLVFTGEGKNRTATPLLTQAEFGSVGFRNDLLDALQGAGLSSVERYENAEGLYHANGEARAINLDGDGVAERVQMCDIVAGGTPVGRRVEIWEGEKLLFSEEGYYAHAGWNALFLCTVDGKDCLLRYHPTMYQGVCSYTFELFTLSRAGEEMTVREGRVEFDVNFQPMLHQRFDPEAIADFMEKVNSLLENSVQLLNTDQDLLGAFEKEGRLYDSLWWLDAFPEEGFTRDPGKSLLENLKDYQTAMEARWYAVEPEIMDMGEAGSDCLRSARLRYQDRTADFFANWRSQDQPYVKVLDLNGDGRDEIVCVFDYLSFAGEPAQELHAFDAQTLEEYDLSGLRESVAGRFKCTEEGTRFYLEGPGTYGPMVIRKGEVEAVSVGEHARYSVEDGNVFCWMSMELTGADLHELRYIRVRLDFTGGGFQIGKEEWELDASY